MSTAKKYLPSYTVEDYRQWKGDWQLIHGIAISMSPSPAGPHERVALRLGAWLLSQLEAGDSNCCPYAGLDWIVSEDTVVRPDVMVVCGDQPEMHLEKPPVLVAEILSPATWKADTEIKRAIYNESGVKVYLLVDTDLKTIEVIDFRTGKVSKIRDSDSITISLPDDLEIEIPAQKIFN